jgi:hypothetical protein
MPEKPGDLISFVGVALSRVVSTAESAADA